MKKNKEIIGVVASLVCNVLYGFSFLFTKSVTETVSPMTVIAWRFLVAFLMFNVCVLLGVLKINFRGKSFVTLFGFALFHPVLYFIGETFGINLTTASESSVIIACIPIVTLLFSTLILKEAPTRLQIIGISISAAGILLIVWMQGLEATFNLVGYLMLVLAVVSYSMFAVLSQKAAEFTVVEKTYAMSAFGAVVFPVIAVVQNVETGTVVQSLLLPFTNFDFLIAVLYLGIGCSIIAFLLSNTAIATIGPNRSSSFAPITTIISVIAGVILLGESFSIFQTIGTIFVLGGVYLANMNAGRRETKEIPVQTV